MDEAESAIRLAVDAAERMAGVEVTSVGRDRDGRPALLAALFGAKVSVGGKAVSDYDVHRVLEAASTTTAQPGPRRAPLACRPASRSTRRAASATRRA